MDQHENCVVGTIGPVHEAVQYWGMVTPTGTQRFGVHLVPRELVLSLAEQRELYILRGNYYRSPKHTPD